MVTLNSLVAAATSQVSVDLPDESVILHTGSGVYFGLDEVAQHVWRAVQDRVLVSDLLAELTREYDVPEGRARDDLLTFLGELESTGLIDVQSSGSGT